MRKKNVIFKVVALMLIGLLGLGSLSQATGDPFQRYSGRNRYETSIQAAKMKNSDILVVANGHSYPDSLSALNLVNKLDAKLILVQEGQDIRDFIKEENISTVFILGGQAVISKEFEAKIPVRTVRISGKNRYETNEKSLELTGYKKVGLASGEGFADALAASRLLLEEEKGLLLANKDNMKIKANKYQVDYIFGGKNSLPEDLVGAERIAGKTRIETALLLAEKTKANNAIIVNGNDFADALSAINLIDVLDSNVVLKAPLSRPEYQGFLAKVLNDPDICILGGLSAVSGEEAVFAIEEPMEKEKIQEIIKEKEEEKPIKQEIKVESITVTPDGVKNGKEYSRLVKAGLSEKEAHLAMMINEYRLSRGLKSLPISKSLTTVARTHVIDSNKHHPIRQKDERGIQGNLHSWSMHSNWTGGAYTPDHKYAPMMWNKPREITNYPGDGYEISCGYLVHNCDPTVVSASMTPKVALDGWKKSPGHHAVIIGEGARENLSTFGVAIDGAYSHVWFGEETDPSGYY